MSRVTSMGPESFHDVWGYCAVIGTRELMWSGYRIPAPDSVADLADYMAGISQGLSLETPRSRKILPVWVSGGILSFTRPSRVGTSSSPPSAASTKATGISQYRLRASKRSM